MHTLITNFRGLLPQCSLFLWSSLFLPWQTWIFGNAPLAPSRHLVAKFSSMAASSITRPPARETTSCGWDGRVSWRRTCEPLDAYHVGKGGRIVMSSEWRGGEGAPSSDASWEHRHGGCASSCRRHALVLVPSCVGVAVRTAL